jgi:hypothetical protein
VRKEFFQLVIKELFDPIYGMFTHYEDTRMHYFARQSLEAPEEFRLLGLVRSTKLHMHLHIHLIAWTGTLYQVAYASSAHSLDCLIITRALFSKFTFFSSCNSLFHSFLYYVFLSIHFYSFRIEKRRRGRRETNAHFFILVYCDGGGVVVVVVVVGVIQVLGLALYNNTILDLHFPPCVYKKLKGEPVGLDDLAVLNPELARGLRQLLEYVCLRSSFDSCEPLLRIAFSYS